MHTQTLLSLQHKLSIISQWSACGSADMWADTETDRHTKTYRQAGHNTCYTCAYHFLFDFNGN